MLPVRLVSKIDKVSVHQGEAVLATWHCVFRLRVDHIERKILEFAQARFRHNLFELEIEFTNYLLKYLFSLEKKEDEKYKL